MASTSEPWPAEHSLPATTWGEGRDGGPRAEPLDASTGRTTDLGLRVGLDIGGTFTDAYAIDDRTGTVHTAKVASTPDDPSVGLFHALDAILRTAGVPDSLAHGTTVATNAIIEGRQARAALVTNRGFRDLLEIGFQSRPSLYDVRVHRAPPLVPRQRCFEIAGRLGPDGEEEEALDEGEVRALGARLAALDPPLEAVVVCLLHSYRSDRHERRVAELLGTRLGEGVLVFASAEVCPEFREYPRASTAVLNAAVAPLMDRYLGAVEAGLRQRGVGCELHLMQSNGGLVAASAARRRPAYAIESGPAAAAIAGAAAARELGIDQALVLDIGGTTAKVAMVLDGQPSIAPELEVGPRAHTPNRLGRSGGYPLRTPCVDLVEIGAGGGSVAWLDPGGALRVGPRSAGAVPGPACYPEGGVEPTLTDANLVLGRLDPARFLGGRVALRPQAAHRVLQRLGEAMGRSAAEAAAGVVAVAIDAMGAALRIATVDKGYDPRGFALLAMGGAGALHACEIAGSVGMRRMVVPPQPGLASAWGLLATDLKVEAVVSWPMPLAAADLAAVDARLVELEATLRRRLEAQGVRDPGRVEVLRALDLRYLGQSFELPIPFAAGEAALADAFHAAHHHRYGFAAPDEPVELVALRVTALGRLTRPRRPRLPQAAGRPQPVDRRRVMLASGPERWVEAPVFERGGLGAGHRLEGPALIVEPEATTYVPPRWAVRVEPTAHLVADEVGDPRAGG
jgi:N-methylhydantoinase A